jgi:hypothetical protein
VNDAEEGFLAALWDTENRAWLSLLRNTHKTPANGGYPAFWSDAERVARTTAEEGAWQRAWPQHGISAANRRWITPRTAATLAWKAIAASNNKQQSIWLPLAHAFEAGLWLVWVLQREIVAVPRPDIRSEAGRLHASDGPAVLWPRGPRYFFWRGLQVPENIITRPVSARRILDEENAELRRVLLERMGYEAFLRALKAKPVDQDEFGILYRAPLRLAREHLAFVRVTNSTPEPDGSRRESYLRVPPTVRTAREAVAWTFGMSEEEYMPHQET